MDKYEGKVSLEDRLKIIEIQNEVNLHGQNINKYMDWIKEFVKKYPPEVFDAFMTECGDLKVTKVILY